MFSILVFFFCLWSWSWLDPKRMLGFGQFDFGHFDFGQLAEIELRWIGTFLSSLPFSKKFDRKQRTGVGVCFGRSSPDSRWRRFIFVIASLKFDRSFIGAFLPDLFSEIFQFSPYLSNPLSSISNMAWTPVKVIFLLSMTSELMQWAASKNKETCFECSLIKKHGMQFLDKIFENLL